MENTFWQCYYFIVFFGLFFQNKLTLSILYCSFTFYLLWVKNFFLSSQYILSGLFTLSTPPINNWRLESSKQGTNAFQCQGRFGFEGNSFSFSFSILSFSFFLSLSILSQFLIDQTLLTLWPVSFLLFHFKYSQEQE